MAEGKSSFVLYSDLIHTLKKLTDVQRGQLMLTILEYVNDLNPVVTDPVIDVVFEPIKQQLKRDLKKYEYKKKQWSNAGKASAKARKNKRKQTLTGVNKRQQTSTVSTVNDNVNVNVNVNVIKKEQFIIFWDSYHSITKLKKSDKEPALKYWMKMTNQEIDNAIKNIKPYYDSLNDKKYCKKARTYLADKNFNDEFVKSYSEPNEDSVYMRMEKKGWRYGQ